MKIEKTRLSIVEVATSYFELAESILQAMIDSTLKSNLPVVFALNRPLFHACYKGMWTCLVEHPSEVPDELFTLGNDIDAVIEERFSSWNAPFCEDAGKARYSALFKSPILKELADEGKIKSSTLIERLHNDVHGGLPSLEYYRHLVQHGSLLLSAKDLCIIGHNPLYLNLRFAISMRFPDGSVRRENLLAEPSSQQILEVYDLPDAPVV
jgi:hypothetical protein